MELAQKTNYGLVIIIYLLLKPIYMFGSGGLQISDIFLSSFFVYFLFKKGFKFNYNNKTYEIVSLVLLICLDHFFVNLIWSTFLDSEKSLHMNLFSMYYIYNAMMFIVCLAIQSTIGTENFKKALGEGCFWSTVISMIGILMYSGSGIRNVGFFNNPNQLGYHALIIYTLMIMCRDSISKKKALIIGVCSAISVFASLSKAAIVSFLVTTLIFILLKNKNIYSGEIVKRLCFLALFIFALFLLLFSENGLLGDENYVMYARYRLLNMFDESDTALGTGRAYDRVFEMGYHLFWGMGEGEYDRFDIMTGYEVHSTYVSLLVCYGIVGFMLYVITFAKIILFEYSRNKGNLLYLIGIFLYFITHNGIRNTIFWIILSLLLCREERERKRHYV